MEEIDSDGYDEGPSYQNPSEIDWTALATALNSLQMLGSDPYLGMQSFNLGVVDQFITTLEYEVLREYHRDERLPGGAVFLSAQSQMWIFAAYELLRTWQQRAREVVKLHKNGGLGHKIAALRKEVGFLHVGRSSYADQLSQLVASPQLMGRLQEDLAITHIPFARLDFIRVALAKHEVKGKRNSIAYAPGYGRLNQECGSLEHQMEMGRVILGNISRRDIADELWAISDRSAPSEDDLKSFDLSMNPPLDPFDETQG